MLANTLSHNGEIWRKSADLGLPPQAKFCNIRLRAYTSLVQINTKSYQLLVVLRPVSPHFESHNNELLREGADLGLPPRAKFCIKKSLKGIGPLGAKFLQKFKIFFIFEKSSGAT